MIWPGGEKVSGSVQDGRGLDCRRTFFHRIPAFRRLDTIRQAPAELLDQCSVRVGASPSDGDNLVALERPDPMNIDSFSEDPSPRVHLSQAQLSLSVQWQ